MEVTVTQPTVRLAGRRANSLTEARTLITLALVLAACSSPKEPVIDTTCLLDPSLPIQLPCSTEPRPIVDDPGFMAVAAGQDHTCALATDGRAFCWGRNAFEPVDFRTGAGIATRPYPVPGDHRFFSITAGGDHTCALDAVGTAWCWGSNHSGQLGIGPQPSSAATPMRVAGDVAFARLIGGRQHTCGIAVDGAAWCWGWDFFGEIGRGIWEMEIQPVPFRVVGGHVFIGLSAGGRFTCGLRDGGDAWCWGHAHIGELGTSQTPLCHDLLGTVRCSPTPIPVATNLRFTAISSGASHTCAVSTDHRAFCWGDDGQHQLGPAAGDRFGLREVAGPRFSSIHAGGSTSCGLTEAGETLCWGGNWMGQLGRNSRAFAEPLPAPLAGGHRFKALSVGLTHACGITQAGATLCWGSNERGQLGAGVW
jgi:alpha-tubulin suppressor-like RCC1 family protein